MHIPTEFEVIEISYLYYLMFSVLHQIQTNSTLLFTMIVKSANQSNKSCKPVKNQINQRHKQIIEKLRPKLCRKLRYKSFYLDKK